MTHKLSRRKDTRTKPSKALDKLLEAKIRGSSEVSINFFWVPFEHYLEALDDKIARSRPDYVITDTSFFYPPTRLECHLDGKLETEQTGWISFERDNPFDRLMTTSMKRAIWGVMLDYKIVYETLLEEWQDEGVPYNIPSVEIGKEFIDVYDRMKRLKGNKSIDKPARQNIRIENQILRLITRFFTIVEPDISLRYGHTMIRDQTFDRIIANSHVHTKSSDPLSEADTSLLHLFVGTFEERKRPLLFSNDVSVRNAAYDLVNYLKLGRGKKYVSGIVHENEGNDYVTFDGRRLRTDMYGIDMRL